MAAGAGAALSISVHGCARAAVGRATRATAITQVFGDGIRLTAVTVEYDQPIQGDTLSADSFEVEGRTVTGVFTSASSSPADRATRGRFVVVTLSPSDASASLAERASPPGANGRPPNGRAGPGKAGTPSTADTVYRVAAAKVAQAKPVLRVDGATIAASGEPRTTTSTSNLIVDEFRQLEYKDASTGKLLRYNLFVPRRYDPSKAYPLVLFMHDAGATSEVTRTTLLQGLGAIIWASAEDQGKHPCFVVAPQYAEIIADDDSQTSDMMDITIRLVTALAAQYSIDKTRLYATGQSGGCMMAIAMNIKYPALFAASLLVAGQWDPALTRPLANKRLWIVVSQDDDKAYTGENAIISVLEAEGAKISRATWDGTWTAEQFQSAFEKIDAETNPINYVTFSKGSVIPRGESAAGASGHRNTWRIAYTIAPVRDWIFRQR